MLRLRLHLWAHAVGRTTAYVVGMYEVSVAGLLPADWSEWFDGFELTVVPGPDGPTTLLRGPVADQAALHGLLARLRDLALPLISVRRVSAHR